MAIEVGQSLRGKDVVRRLDKLKPAGRKPKLLFCHDGSEFAGQAMDPWAYQNCAKIDFSRPGKPTYNAFIELFNGTFRDECLNVLWFETLTEARQHIETWRREYNGIRPHRALGEKTPSEFASQFAASHELAAT
jgi:putative transposase